MLEVGEVVNSLNYIQPLGAMSGLATSQMGAVAAAIALGGLQGEEAETASREVLTKLLNGRNLQPHW
ncbi:MAG: hypothetical protein ABSG46_03725 [Candidatus Binataceae bacterium]|jgi:hypothetical protein